MTVRQMDLVLRNPFRVLGLPVTATSREIAKRVSDLEVLREVGKEADFAADFPVCQSACKSFQLSASKSFQLISPFLPASDVA